MADSEGMKSERLQEIRERANKAAPGPWRAYANEMRDDGWLFVGQAVLGALTIAEFNRWADLLDRKPFMLRTIVPPAEARFIADARTDVPELLDEIERLRGVLGEIRNLLSGRGLSSVPDLTQFFEAIDAILSREGA